MRLSLGRLVRRVVKENHMWNHLALIFGKLLKVFFVFIFIFQKTHTLHSYM